MAVRPSSCMLFLNSPENTGGNHSSLRRSCLGGGGEGGDGGEGGGGLQARQYIGQPA